MIDIETALKHLRVVNNVQSDEESKPSLESEEIRTKTIFNNSLEEDQTIRKRLISILTRISSCWLGFTACIILLASCGLSWLSNSALITFITTSLSAVLGLWIIGLNYFFCRK